MPLYRCGHGSHVKSDLELLICDFLETDDDVFAVRVSSELYDVLLHVSHDGTSLSLVTHIDHLQWYRYTHERKQMGSEISKR